MVFAAPGGQDKGPKALELTCINKNCYTPLGLPSGFFTPYPRVLRHWGSLPLLSARWLAILKQTVPLTQVLLPVCRRPLLQIERRV